MTMGADILGDDMEGDVMGGPFEVIGAAPGHRLVKLPNRPAWRAQQWAPGVNQPAEGLVPLQLTPANATGLFTSATTNVVFTGRLQKPFRPERIVVTQTQQGTATVLGGAGLQVLAQQFIGVDLQQATTQPVNLSALGATTAFGVRMALSQAPPGVEISLTVSLFPVGVLTGTDNVFVTIMYLGRIVH